MVSFAVSLEQTATIKKIFESIGKFIVDCFDKLSKFVSDKETDQKMRMINSLKNNRDANKVNIEIDDVKSQKANIEQYRQYIKSCRKKLKSGEQLTDSEKDMLDKHNKKCKSNINKITIGAVSAAVAAAGIMTTVKTTDIKKKYDADQQDYENRMRSLADDIADASSITPRGYVDKKSPVYARWKSRVEKYSGKTMVGPIGYSYRTVMDTFNCLTKHETELCHIETQYNLRQGSIFNKACAALARAFGHIEDSSTGITTSDIEGKKKQTNEILDDIEKGQRLYARQYGRTTPAERDEVKNGIIGLHKKYTPK